MGNKVFKNSIYNTIYQGFQVLFPLITSAYISRVLQPEGVGSISFANTVVTYFVVLGSLGLPNYGIKAIAQSNDNIKIRSKTFFELFIINVFSTSFSLIIYYSLINFLPYFAEKRLLLNIIGIQLLLNFFNIDWFFQGIEAYKSITLRSFVVKISSFILMLLFVRTSSDIYKYALILCLGVGGNYLYNILLVNKYVVVSKYSISIKQHIKPVLTLYAATVASQIYQMVDSIMLDYYYPSQYLGYYSNCVKIVRMIHTFTIALVIPFFSRISEYIRKNQQKEYNELMTIGSKLLFIITIPCALGMEVLSKEIVLVLFGDKYLPSVFCLRILSPLVIILSFAYFNGQINLISHGVEKKILYVTIISAIINTVMNYFFIPIYAHYGAAMASVFAEILVTVIVIMMAKGYYKIKIEKQFVLSCIISNAVLVISLVITKTLIRNNIILIFVSIPLAAFMYFFTLFATKNDILVSVVTACKK